MDFLKKITLGRYIDTGSIVHRLDPRTKLITLIITSLIIFYGTAPDARGIFTLAALFTVSFLIIPLAGIRIRYVVKCILKFYWFFVLILIFHTFFTPGRVIQPLSQYGIIITYDGLNNALVTIAKLYTVIQCTYIFILTTSPLEMTNGIKKLFGFLKVFRVPVDDLAIMITLAIKFIPTFFKEIQKITAAQKARGIDFKEGSIRRRIKSISLIVTPVFYNTFKRAEELNTAMISRGYRAGRKRGSYKKITLLPIDYIILITITALFVANIVMG